jgi:hypothetical protein
MLKVESGIRPARPLSFNLAWTTWGLTEMMWSLMQQCWEEEPGTRPPVEEVIAQLDCVRREDHRPLEIKDVVSPASFRNSMGGHLGASGIRDIEALISACLTVDTSSDTNGV